MVATGKMTVADSTDLGMIESHLLRVKRESLLLEMVVVSQKPIRQFNIKKLRCRMEQGPDLIIHTKSKLPI